MTDELLWAAFHDRTLPEKDWTHRAHLRVAWMYVSRYALDEAHLLFRLSLVRLNTVHGVPESAQRGYHETLTRFWLHQVRALIDADAGSSSDAFIERHSARLQTSAPLTHYSRELLFSVRARSVFVEPDRQPLPHV
jgi:hypothetical protein